jgi:hypothetical protein
MCEFSVLPAGLRSMKLKAERFRDRAAFGAALEDSHPDGPPTAPVPVALPSVAAVSAPLNLDGATQAGEREAARVSGDQVNLDLGARLWANASWIAFGQLLSAWAIELSQGGESSLPCESKLKKLLLGDFGARRFDNAGPWEQFRRFGLKHVTTGGRREQIFGSEATKLLLEHQGSFDPLLLQEKIYLSKLAVLDFARRQGLLPPSWWSSDRTAISENGDLLIASAKKSNRPNSVLAKLLRKNADLPRDEAKAFLRSCGFEFSERGFQNRIWPGARSLAGLEQRAPPGRKPRPTPKSDEPA